MLLEATGPYFIRLGQIPKQPQWRQLCKSSVTANAKRNQIKRCVVTELTSSFQMVDLEVPWSTAILASPSVTLQDLVMKRFVLVWVQFYSRLLLA